MMVLGIIGLVLLGVLVSAAGSVLTLGWLSRQVGGVEITFDTDGDAEVDIERRSDGTAVHHS